MRWHVVIEGGLGVDILFWEVGSHQAVKLSKNSKMCINMQCMIQMLKPYLMTVNVRRLLICLQDGVVLGVPL